MCPQQVPVAMLALGFLWRLGRQDVPVAHPHHLRAASIYRASRSGDMGKVLRILRVAYIDNRGSVGLHLAVERIDACPGMMAHIGDFPVTLVDDKRLVGGPAL